MKITIAAIGRASARSPEHALFQEYVKRLKWKCQLHEIELKKNLPATARKTQEAALLLEAAAPASRIIALDERGRDLGSEELARHIAQWQQQGCSHLACLIGGSDGLDDTARQRADLVLAFGRATWPHLMVRAMLAEQLYRAQTLLDGHPYHRA